MTNSMDAFHMRVLDEAQQQLDALCENYAQGKISRDKVQAATQGMRQRLLTEVYRMRGPTRLRRERLLRRLRQLSEGFDARPAWRAPRQHSSADWAEVMISIVPTAGGFGIGGYLRRGRHTLATMSRQILGNTEKGALRTAQNQLLRAAWNSGARRVRLYIGSAQYLVISPSWKRVFEATEILYVSPGNNSFSDRLARRAARPIALPVAPSPDAMLPNREKPRFSMAGILSQPDAPPLELRTL